MPQGIDQELKDVVIAEEAYLYKQQNLDARAVTKDLEVKQRTLKRRIMSEAYAKTGRKLTKFRCTICGTESELFDRRKRDKKYPKFLKHVKSCKGNGLQE